jgi:hypothetical protein
MNNANQKFQKIHLPSLAKSAAQCLTHAFALDFLDSQRSGWRDGEDHPAPLAKSTTDRLREVLGSARL